MPRSAKGLSILLVVAALACGKDDPADPFGNGGGNLEGMFEATVAGSAAHALSGTATFSSVAGVGFVLTLIDTDGVGSISVHRNDAGRPGTGTFSIGEASGTTTGMFASGTAGGAIFNSVSGTLSISRSNAGSLQGTLQFQGTGVTGDSQPGNFTINATFDANCFAFGVTCNQKPTAAGATGRARPRGRRVEPAPPSLAPGTPDPPECPLSYRFLRMHR